MNKRKGKTSYIALKIDIAKVYDKVEWSLLAQILKLHGFSERFVNLIVECISTTSFSILVNGSLTV